jgi:hypothetical protein
MCNHNLLLWPDILLTKPISEQETQTPQPNVVATNSVTQTISVNTDTGAACDMFDIVMNQKNTEAARQRYRKRQVETNQLQKRLDCSKKLTSGEAFKRGLIGLYHPEVLDHQVEKDNFERQKSAQ